MIQHFEERQRKQYTFTDIIKHAQILERDINAVRPFRLKIKPQNLPSTPQATNFRAPNNTNV
jgi:hypothetical protein